MGRSITATVCLAVLMFSLFAGCRTEHPHPPVHIRIGIESEPITLNPHAHDDTATWVVQSNLYEGLVAFDPQLKIVPCLAQSWGNPDQTTWRFVLKKEVKFHNGKTLDSADVEYSIRHAMNDPASQVRGKLAGIVKISSASPGSIDIKTRSPDPILLNKLTTIYIVPANSFETGKLSGTGPYQMASVKIGPVMRAKRFSGYHGEPPQIDEVTFVALNNVSERHTALLENRVDLLKGLSVDYRDLVKRSPGFRVISVAGTSVSYLGFRFNNKPKSPFDDPSFRRAIYLSIGENLAGGGEAPSQPVPPSVFGYNPAIPKRKIDVAAARRLIAAGGWQGARVVLELPENARKQLGELLLEDFRNIGLNPEVISYPWKEFYRKMVGGELHFYFTAWVYSSGDAGEFLESCLHSRNSEYGEYNVGGFVDPELDALIEKSHSMLDNKERKMVLQQAQQRIFETMPVVPVTYVNDCYGARRNIAWTPRADGRILVRDIRLQF